MLEAGTERLKKTNKDEIDALLKPFGDRLDEFGKQVREAYGNEREQQGELSAKLKQLFELNQKMTEEAHNLTQALTGNTKVQGDWGELQLETLLQNAGLEKDVHYEVQDTGRNADGKLLRPDFVVKLPDNRLVIIDSKVSLTAYAAWTAAEDNAARKTAMKSHYGSMERHVRDLGEKRYQDLYGTAPDFVLMYIPVEPALSVDFERQNTLYQMAAGKKVVPVTTSTLLGHASFDQLSLETGISKAKCGSHCFPWPAAAEKIQWFPERPETDRHQTGTGPKRPHWGLPKALNGNGQLDQPS